jgi:nucleotide-binding universal stress UspA family protein
MSTMPPEVARGTAAERPVGRTSSTFVRIVVGIDGTEASYEACRQAVRLLDPGGELELFRAVYLAGSTFGGWPEDRVAAELEREAGQSLDHARHLAGPAAAGRLVDGAPAESLLEEIGRRRATLVAVGSHDHSRTFELMLGSVAASMLHRAPCSVLLARPSREPERFPRAVAVGMDGSTASLAAFAVAASLAERFGVPLRGVVALADPHLDLARVREAAPFAEQVAKHAVPALVEASEHAELLVVGSRGLHGLATLGSVSERVAHRARCSVLVVREEAAG